MVPTLRPRNRKSLRLFSIYSPYLTTNVLIEILKRLPLKSLVRFTCICKSWYSLLTSSTFIATLSAFNLQKTQKFLLFKESINIHMKSNSLKFMIYNAETQFKESCIECPIGRNHFIVGSANGLICLFNFYSRNPKIMPLILWNPSIQKAVLVHVPECDELKFTTGGFPKYIFGVGFDWSSNDYKVVRIAYINSGKEGTALHSDIYSVNNDKWTKLRVTVMSDSITTIRWRGVYLNGIIHWICNGETINTTANSITYYEVHRFILTFNLRNEELGVIRLPKELMSTPYQTMSRLRVVAVPRGGKDVLGVTNNVKCEFSLWVMENCSVRESWVQMYSISFKSRIKNDMNVLIFSENNVLALTSLGGWVSYDHTTQEFFYFMAALPENLDYVDSYVESLVLLGRRRRVLHCCKEEQDCPLYPQQRRIRSRRRRTCTM